MATAHDFRLIAGSRVQALNVLFRDNQHVRRGLRIDVLKSKGMLVLINLPGWYLSGNNLTEKAAFHVSSLAAASACFQLLNHFNPVLPEKLRLRWSWCREKLLRHGPLSRL